MKRKSRSGTGGLIYSTHPGAMCPKCRRAMTACTCVQVPLAASDGVVRVGRETKGRKGKGVTVVTGVLLPPEELVDLAADLKRRCGAGGTVKDWVIEIQGDHRDTVVALLEWRGFQVRRSGG